MVKEQDNPIRNYLEDVGKTQAEFAELIGVQTATVNGWCNNKNTDMKASNILKINEVTGINLEALVRWAAAHALEIEGWTNEAS